MANKRQNLEETEVLEEVKEKEPVVEEKKKLFSQPKKEGGTRVD